MRSKNKFCTVSLVCGIFSLVLMMFGVGLPFGAIGLITAFLSKDAEPIRGRAIAGFITSLIGLIGSLVIIAFSLFNIFYDGAYNSIIDEFYDYYSEDDYDDLYDKYNDSDYTNNLLSYNISGVLISELPA